MFDSKNFFSCGNSKLMLHTNQFIFSKQMDITDLKLINIQEVFISPIEYFTKKNLCLTIYGKLLLKALQPYAISGNETLFIFKTWLQSDKLLHQTALDV